MHSRAIRPLARHHCRMDILYNNIEVMLHCLRPLDPYINRKLSVRRLRRLFYMGGYYNYWSQWGYSPK
jgi:hypothetical protein